jgi:hypothetical protein
MLDQTYQRKKLALKVERILGVYYSPFDLNDKSIP